MEKNHLVLVCGLVLSNPVLAQDYGLTAGRPPTGGEVSAYQTGSSAAAPGTHWQTSEDYLAVITGAHSAIDALGARMQLRRDIESVESSAREDLRSGSKGGVLYEVRTYETPTESVGYRQRTLDYVGSGATLNDAIRSSFFLPSLRSGPGGAHGLLNQWHSFGLYFERQGDGSILRTIVPAATMGRLASIVQNDLNSLSNDDYEREQSRRRREAQDSAIQAERQRQAERDAAEKRSIQEKTERDRLTGEAARQRAEKERADSEKLERYERMRNTGMVSPDSDTRRIPPEWQPYVQGVRDGALSRMNQLQMERAFSGIAGANVSASAFRADGLIPLGRMAERPGVR